MTTTLSKPPRSHLSNFFHDLVTVDFHQIDINTGVRVAAFLIIVTVLGLITGHAAQASFVWIGAAYVLTIDLVLDLINRSRSKGTRTRVLLTVSVLYASIFAIGMVISMVDYLVVPLLALGLFIISYFAVYPKAFWTLFYASLMFVIAIAFHGATLAMAGQNFLLIFVGGLWAIVGGIIFLARKTSKQQRTVTADPIQEQLQPQLTWQDRFKPLTSNLSIHSHHLQYAILFAITGAVGMLIIQWFKLPEGDWVLISIVNILAPVYSDISLTLRKVIHRIIGTIIGAIIALIIIDSVHNIWILSYYSSFSQSLASHSQS
ncbi:MAG: FUSC family protein [Nitrososphaeraceae archaeon]